MDDSTVQVPAMNGNSKEPETITAENVQVLFPGCVEYLALPKEKPVSETEKELQGYEKKQAEAMGEVCILLDPQDSPIGGGTKYICHRLENINRGLLHRAFSVFLFDSQNRLLLQQRANEKVTYSKMWTNTCCSHPLNFPLEAGIELGDAVLGVKRAAVRKVWDELRIKSSATDPHELQNKMEFLTRIIYRAVNIGDREIKGEEKWGEHEIDYILFIKIDIAHTPNPEEAQDTRYVTQDELKAMLADESLKFTPWFTLIAETDLYRWWDNLAKGKEITTEKEGNEIIDMRDEEVMKARSNSR